MSHKFSCPIDPETGCEAPAAHCDVCHGEVYAGDLVHVINGFIVCPECFSDYAFDYFADCLRLGSEIQKGECSQ